MKRVMGFIFSLLESFAHPSVENLSRDLRYLHFLVPAYLLFCLIDSILFGIFSRFYLNSDSLSWFAFVSILSLLVLLAIGRFAVEGQERLRNFLGLLVFGVASLVIGRNTAVYWFSPEMSDTMFLQAFSVSSLLSILLLFGLIVIYTKAWDFALIHREDLKHSHDSDRLTQEFVTLAGDMNSVMQGPLEDVLSAVRGLRYGSGSTEQNLMTIKRGSNAVYGIARSFGILAQDQKEPYMVRINLDELVRYAQIVCQNHFYSLGVALKYEAGDEPFEFMGASGRWLLLLVSLMQFMAEQIHRTGGRRLLLKRQLRDGEWELVLLAEGAAPFDFPFDLRQKLKEESTRELLNQTSSRAFLYLLDQWGLKIGSFQTA